MVSKRHDRSTHLSTVVHLPRELGVEEAHQLIDLDTWVALLPPVELGLRVVRSTVPCTDMVVEVIVVRLDVVVAMAVIESAFVGIAQHLHIVSMSIGPSGAHLICLL